MKIIFLDIDGVLCTYRSHLAENLGSKMRAWDATGVDLLKAILTRDSNIKIVITSTWRIGCPFSLEYFENESQATDLHQKLTQHGMWDYLHTDWRTIEGKRFRGDEIDAWLHAHRDLIDDYVILDDDSDFHLHHKPHFLQTDPINGLTVQDFALMRERFFGKQNSFEDLYRKKCKFGRMLQIEYPKTLYMDVKPRWEVNS